MRFIGKFSRDERGIGSLVGAAFLILILLSGFAFYMLSVNVTDEYRESLGTMDQLDLKRKQEKLEFVSVSTTDENKLNITVENTGPYQTHLIWLGVFDETAPPSTQNYYELNGYYINPAQTETGIGSTEMDNEIVEEHQYTIQLITDLGNIVVYSYPPEEEDEESWVPPPEYFGVFSLDWFYFEYTSSLHPEPIHAGNISKGESYVAFHIRVANNWNQSVTILGRSMMRFMVEVHGQAEPVFYIVKSVRYNGSPQISAYNDAAPITVEPQESENLVFAANQAYGDGWKWMDKTMFPVAEPETAIVMIGLVFTIEGSPEVQAQSLPFRAIFLDE